MNVVGAKVVGTQPRPLKMALDLILQRSRARTVELGFFSEAARLSVEELREDPSVPSEVRTQLQSSQILCAYPRGVEIALVEDVVRSTNASVKSSLGAVESAQMFPSSVAAQEAANDQSLPRTEAEAVYLGLHLKFSALRPYARHWSRAVGLETRLENAPYALVNLVTLCDDISYFAERIQNRGGFQSGAPLRVLNDSPHNGFTWYWRRGKLLPIYTTAALHMIGDESQGSAATFDFLRSLVQQAFG
jgi:hypothetical protein